MDPTNMVDQIIASTIQDTLGFATFQLTLSTFGNCSSERLFDHHGYSDTCAAELGMVYKSLSFVMNSQTYRHIICNTLIIVNQCSCHFRGPTHKL